MRLNFLYLQDLKDLVGVCIYGGIRRFYAYNSNSLLYNSLIV